MPRAVTILLLTLGALALPALAQEDELPMPPPLVEILAVEEFRPPPDLLWATLYQRRMAEARAIVAEKEREAAERSRESKGGGGNTGGATKGTPGSGGQQGAGNTGRRRGGGEREREDGLIINIRNQGVSVARKETVKRVHAWDGFAREQLEFWLLDDLPGDDEIAPGRYFEIETESTSAKADGSGWERSTPVLAEDEDVEDDGVSSPSFSFDELKRLKRIRSEPDGFYPARLAAIRPYWETMRVKSFKDIQWNVLVHQNRLVSRLVCVFKLPDGRMLSNLRFEIYPLDEYGERLDPIVGGRGKSASSGGAVDALLATLDPDRRYAFGFEIEIIEAHERRYVDE